MKLNRPLKYADQIDQSLLEELRGISSKHLIEQCKYCHKRIKELNDFFEVYDPYGFQVGTAYRSQNKELVDRIERSRAIRTVLAERGDCPEEFECRRKLNRFQAIMEDYIEPCGFYFIYYVGFGGAIYELYKWLKKKLGGLKKKRNKNQSNPGS